MGTRVSIIFNFSTIPCISVYRKGKCLLGSPHIHVEGRCCPTAPITKPYYLCWVSPNNIGELNNISIFSGCWKCLKFEVETTIKDISGWVEDLIPVLCNPIYLGTVSTLELVVCCNYGTATATIPPDKISRIKSITSQVHRGSCSGRGRTGASRGRAG